MDESHYISMPQVLEEKWQKIGDNLYRKEIDGKMDYRICE